MTAPDTVDSAMCDPCNAAVTIPLSTHSQRDNETIITYLERLCDEYNAIPIDEN